MLQFTVSATNGSWRLVVLLSGRNDALRDWEGRRRIRRINATLTLSKAIIIAEKFDSFVSIATSDCLVDGA